MMRFSQRMPWFKIASHHFEMILAMSEYIYSAISNRRICAAYARLGLQSHLDRREALSCIRLFAPKRASPAPLRLCGSVLSVKLSDIAKNLW